MEETLSQFMMPVVAVVVYCVCYVIKHTAGDAADRYIPLVAAVLGVVCSAVIAVAGSIDTTNVVEVVAQGLVSGLAATGVWEFWKQSGKVAENGA